MVELIVIGVAGASGSGKSLLSKTIIEELGSDHVVVISEDHYYNDNSNLSMEERNKINYDHPDAFDHKFFKEQIESLAAGRSVEVPIYDYTQHNRSKTETMHVSHKNTIYVLEGILIFDDPELRNLMDIKIFMDTPPDMSFIRRLKRDISERGRSVESVIDQYEKTVRPMYFRFIEPSKRHADIIVPNGGKNKIAIDVIRAKLKEML
ncbi:uridine kinase [Francisellaceae bacterium]|nr:uridine kinase [Francisellaceae bacterium]